MAITDLPLTPFTSSSVTAVGHARQLQFDAPGPPSFPALADFHPAVRTWFTRSFPLGPTPPQEHAWPSIAAGNDTLVAAPTGSGKTLSAFLVSIDQLYKRHDAGTLMANTAQVVYVSPLKALAVDISENLSRPLDEIAAIALELGYQPPALRVGVRSGDTTSSQRSSMVRKPPEFIVTTPESLYLMVTAEKSRDALRTVQTVIIDEIHAVARDKRGSHLTLSLERLEHICGDRPVRIGLSATQRPIETVARMLVGSARSNATGAPDCTIVDAGHQRHLDLELVLPEGELEALPAAEMVAELLDEITEMIEQHHTTLVFVNTRRMAERIAHQLAERLGDDKVAAHHGSLSKDRRERVERKLRAGEFKALVATASLELGIDIGPIELVCQIGSPRSIATFLQRVGRSGHTRHGTPKGRLFPLSRDSLVECAALLSATKAGRLDAILPPVAPLDILAQQIVAETAAERWNVDDLYTLMKGASPYAELTREVFDEVLDFTTKGIVTGRGPKGAYVHFDEINGEVEGRRGARLASLTSGGAIPETADYRVIADPDDMRVGSVGEDWATESLPGDIFLLGTHSWQIRRIEPGVVRVVDAGGKPPTIPVWLGEAPARTQELSEEVSSLRAGVQRLIETQSPRAAVAWVIETCDIDPLPAEMIVAYLAASLAVLGDLPTTERLVIERFFDQTGGMQLVVHSPFGGRINRAFGLASAQEVLCELRLRTPGGGERRLRATFARPSAQLPPRRGQELPQVRTGATDLDSGRAGAAVADVYLPVAVESEPLTHRAAVEGRSQEPAADSAHGSRRCHGRSISVGCWLPGTHQWADRNSQSSDRAPNHVRHVARGYGRRRVVRACQPARIRRPSGHLCRLGRTVTAMLMSYSLALRSPFSMPTPKPSTAGPGQCPCGVAFLSTSPRSVASTYQRSIRSGSKPNPTFALPTSSTTYSPTWSVPGHVRSGKTSSTSSYIATER